MNVEIVERKGKNYKKLNISGAKRAFFRCIKKHFS